ncbi:MAG TPA: DUF2934 domain-containing protein [Steroidobacteraceae bacterium]|nr:DUF2934 domain-containing protein [Steroidobacteraceae bacterium]
MTEIAKSRSRKGSQRPADAPLPRTAATARAPQALLSRMQAPITAAQRYAMICEAAYFLAERRGFGAGHELEDWVAAEALIDAKLADGRYRAP